MRAPTDMRNISAEVVGGRTDPSSHLFVWDCVVDDPVLSEPVSSLNSLLAGKMQGIFASFNWTRQTSARLNQ
jgi:hypothetical protein